MTRLRQAAVMTSSLHADTRECDKSQTASWLQAHLTASCTLYVSNL